MSEEKIRIISDLVKINRYRSHLAERDRLFSQEMYSDQSIDDLKKIHEIYTRYLMEYKTFGEPYPSVIESLEYKNDKINSCITDHRHKAK